jgi:hypothetical protein
VLSSVSWYKETRCLPDSHPLPRKSDASPHATTGAAVHTNGGDMDEPSSTVLPGETRICPTPGVPRRSEPFSPQMG